MSKYQTIYKEELEVFRNICSDEGYDLNEFIFDEHDVQLPDKVGSVYGEVTISRKGKRKTYKTGTDSSWPADFENDLRNNFFV